MKVGGINIIRKENSYETLCEIFLKGLFKIKKILTMILTLIIISSFGVIANAEAATSNFVGGDIQATAEEEADFLESLSDEEIALMNAKIQEANDVANRPMARAATKISIPGSFTIYQQETSYYCVPACVKSVLKYLTGTTYSQSSIANAMGTTTSGTYSSKIAPYLNEKQDYNYIRTTYPEQNTMCNFLYYAVANHDTPALMSIVNSTGANWHYATNGHRLVVNAVYSDDSRIQFADPLGGTKSDWPYYYEKSSSVVNSVCSDIIW